MDWDSFFLLHRDLPREGPGEPDDIAWMAGIADIAPNAAICDVGCGPGSDLGALRELAPEGRVLGIDTVGAFVAQAQARHAGDPGIAAEVGDMSALPGHPGAPFDLIWSAGALYFLGLDSGPAVMANALRSGGVLALSEPAWFTDAPSADARALWEDYPARSEAGVAEAVAAAGLAVLGQRRLADSAWEGYFQPIEARIEALRPDADAALLATIAAAEAEAARWRRVRRETGYTLVVARKP